VSLPKDGVGGGTGVRTAASANRASVQVLGRLISSRTVTSETGCISYTSYSAQSLHCGLSALDTT
jgi:hypothetical protein